MRVQTTRFGEVEISVEDLVDFAEGLLGFSQLRRFVILDDPNDEIFAWLQSCENPDIAFPILEPELFAPNYAVELSKADLEALQLTDQKSGKFFNIITIPADPTLMTANLKAPVIINIGKRLARQCVLQDNNLAIREPIFSKLQQRVVQNPAARFKPEPANIGAVQIKRDLEAEV
jgi:flagellar assembly factor FliW